MGVTTAEFVHVACPKCLAQNRVDAARVNEGPKCGKCDTPLLDAGVVELDEASFDAFVSRTSVPVLVDFWAPWCGPCRQMAPEFAQAARRLAGRARLAKVNTDLSQVPGRAFRDTLDPDPAPHEGRAARQAVPPARALPRNSSAGSLPPETE